MLLLGKSPDKKYLFSSVRLGAAAVAFGFPMLTVLAVETVEPVSPILRGAVAVILSLVSAATSVVLFKCGQVLGVEGAEGARQQFLSDETAGPDRERPIVIFAGPTEVREVSMDFQDPELQQLRVGYISRLPTRLKELKEAQERGDFTQLADRAHRLAGASLFGLTTLSELACDLEDSAHAHNEGETEALLESIFELCGKYNQVEN